jgi:hypothetical protein
MVSSGLLRSVALVRTDVSEEPGASIRVTKIGELETTQAATSNRRKLRRNTKGRFLQEPHGVTTQKTPFFIVTAVKTSNLTCVRRFILNSVSLNTYHFLKHFLSFRPKRNKDHYYYGHLRSAICFTSLE